MSDRVWCGKQHQSIRAGLRSRFREQRHDGDTVTKDPNPGICTTSGGVKCRSRSALQPKRSVLFGSYLEVAAALSSQPPSRLSESVLLASRWLSDLRCSQWSTRSDRSPAVTSIPP